MRTRGLGLFIFAFGTLMTALVGGLTRAADATGIEFFEKRIRPVLAEYCYDCHSHKAETLKADLFLDNREGVFGGGKKGAVVVPREPDKSRLIQAIQSTHHDLHMTPKKKLPAALIADLIEWVKMGAPWPEELVSAIANATTPDPDAETQAFLKERRRHWAYQPVRLAAIPAVKDPGWPASEIDSFILAKLEENGLAPAPPADRRTLIRRATYDLIGLPPTRDEVEDFLHDSSPNAFGTVVDRLLASPHYGERWARHWLDLVRFSETLGFEFDFDLYHGWRYRDYVIRAFNLDLPYDQFVVEHFAGDLIPQPRRDPTEKFNESIIATGFFWMGEGRQTPVDIRQEQADIIDGQIDVLGKAFLGQTIACARCHDHKFDAITTQDYYALAGYLKSSRYQQAFIDPPDRIAAKARQMAALKKKIRDLVANDLAGNWLEQASQSSRYLLAARKMMNGSGVDGTSPKEIAREFDVDEAQLERWVKALQEKDVNEPGHPLYAWSQLGNRTEPATNEFPQRRKALLAALREQENQAARAIASIQLFEDFHRPGYESWYSAGAAFDTGPALPGDIILGDRPNRPVARFVSGGAHSGLLSTRLQGDLRSQTFTITKPYIHCQIAGRNARLNLIIDGYTLIMNPMYGGLTIAATNEQPAWRTMAVDRWIGHRAYIEVSDSSIPMHRLNPPPSTARVPENPSDGYIEVNKIYFSDALLTPPSAAPNRLNLDAVDQDGCETSEALAETYEKLMVQELERWRARANAVADETARENREAKERELQIASTSNESGASDPGTRSRPVHRSGANAALHSEESSVAAKIMAEGGTEDGVILLNWLLQNGLLDAAGRNSKNSQPRTADSLDRAEPLDDTETRGRGRPLHDQLAAWMDQYHVLEASLPSPLRTPALADGTGEDEFVFVRGNYKTLGKHVPRRPPEVIAGSRASDLDKGSGRLALARRLVDPSNPLIARVLVNRIWQHHFGEGLVRTPDDFGRMGQPPTHPELLDYLAGEFVRHGWSIKEMHRLMMITRAYQMSSRPDAAQVERDPENRLLHHMPVRRLEAEAIRDAILAVSGRLNRTVYGPSVLPFLNPYMEGRGRPNSGPLDGDGRRSIYINARRNFPVPMLVAFDYPASFSTTGRRAVSTVPEQAMTLMNDPFVAQQAARWAGRVLAEPAKSLELRVDALYQAAFARPPSETELRNALDFLEQQAGRHGCGLEDPKAWSDLCHVLINVKEFIFIN